MLEPGNVLSDKYKILEKIGMGGMGAVYRAEEIEFNIGRSVAIKVLPMHLAADERLVNRFHEEMKILAQLDHPNIVPIYNIGQSGPTIYFVMKFLRGETLKARVRRGAMAAAQVVHVMLQLARAVAHIHKAGAIHRDIKSVNIMLDNEDQATLMDFGIAKLAGGANLTTDGEVLGTAPYMAPEQWEGRHDPRTDIYALGVLAYEMASGAPPFGGDSLSEIMAAHLHQPPTPLRRIRPQVPEPLAEVIHRCLEKSPDDRFATTADLLAALEFVARTMGLAEPNGLSSTTQGVMTRLQLQNEPSLSDETVARVEQCLADGAPGTAFLLLLDKLPESMTHGELSEKLNYLKALSERDEQVLEEADTLLADDEITAARQLLDRHLQEYPASKARAVLAGLDEPPRAEVAAPTVILAPPALEPTVVVTPRMRAARQRRRWPLITAGAILVMVSLAVIMSFAFPHQTSEMMVDVGDWCFEIKWYAWPPGVNAIRTYKLAVVYDDNNARAHKALRRAAWHLATVAHGFAERGDYKSAMSYMNWALKVDYRATWVRSYNRYYDLRKKK